MLFKEPDLVAYGGGREAEFVGRPLEAEVPRRGLESAQRTQWWKSSHARHRR
jgi:hypothetical protein